MTVHELITALNALPGSAPVYIRQETLTANLAEVERVNETTYSFFGFQLPCVILEQHQKESPPP